jgi:hypothetical protein
MRKRNLPGWAPLPPFDAEMTRSLGAIFDTIIPPGEFPRGWAGGVEKMLREHDFLVWCAPALHVGTGPARQSDEDMAAATLVERMARRLGRPLSDPISSSN